MSEAPQPIKCDLRLPFHLRFCRDLVWSMIVWNVFLVVILVRIYGLDRPWAP